MRKLLCILIAFCMLLLMACSSDVVNNVADNENNNINTKVEEKTGNNADQKNTPAVGNAKNNNSNDLKNTVTPVPDKGVLSAESSVSGTLESKETIKLFDEKDAGKDGLLVILYYQDADGSIVPLSRRIAKQNSIARAAINGLIDSTINREEIEYYGVYPVLPLGTQILGINVVNGVATIDFNSKITNYKTEAAERNIIASVVYTLTQFDSIKGVRIWIDGKPMSKLKYNSDVSGILSRENTMVNSSKLNLNKGMAKSDIYVNKYINDKYSYIVPVSIDYSIINEDSVPYKIVELLTMSSNTNKKYYSAIPVKTKLIDYSISGGLLTLNFNSEIRNYGGNENEEALLKQIAYTAKQIEGIRKIRILVEGKSTVLPEGTELYNDIKLPESINGIIEE